MAQEGALMMVLHSFIIAVILFLVMVYALKQDKTVAMDRSVLVGGIVLVYMVLFGHGLPTSINPNIYR
jgi:hypothetical protein